MEFDSQWFPLAAAIVAAIASVIVTVLRAEGAPREVRLIAKLAEARGHLEEKSPAAKELDASLRESIKHYEKRAALRRVRTLNKFNVGMTVVIGAATIAGVYGLTNLALRLSEINVWAAIGGWTLLVVAGFFLVVLFAASTMTIYKAKSPAKKD